MKIPYLPEIENKPRVFKQKQRIVKKTNKIDFIREAAKRGYVEREETLTENEKKIIEIRLEKRRKKSREENIQIQKEIARR